MNTELKNRPTISSEREKRHRTARIAIGIACVLLALFIAWDISKLGHKTSTGNGAIETAPGESPSSGGAAPGYGTPGSGNFPGAPGATNQGPTTNDAPGTNLPAPKGGPAAVEGTKSNGGGASAGAGNTGINTATDSIGGAPTSGNNAEPQGVMNSQTKQERKR